MLIFNLTIHNVLGRVLTKYPQSRALAYGDDGYIKARMSVALQVLAELKYVLEEDADLTSTSPRPPSSPRTLHISLCSMSRKASSTTPLL
jgi:hypothetical protein